MKRALFLLIIVSLYTTGCAVTGGRDAARGRKAFSAMQAAVEQAALTSRDTVALVKLKGMKTSNQRMLVLSGGSLRQAGGSGEQAVTALILTTNGYAVIARELDPGDITRMEAWVGGDEYRARLIKSDKQLGMSIIKIDADVPLKALDTAVSEDLRAGDWCVGVQPSDEQYDYEQFTSLALCRGQVDGRYRTFLLDDAAGIKEGTPMVGLSGKVIGIVHKRGHVLAMSDLHDDLLALLNDARGVTSADEDAKEQAWLGAILTAINREYAIKHGLDRSAVWAQYVIENGSADSAGVKTGDLIVKANGQKIRFEGDRAYRYLMKTLHPKVGSPFTVTVLRNGKTMKLSGSFQKKPEDETVQADDLGITVKKIEDGDIATRNLFSETGVYVTDIKKGSAAALGNNMRNSLLTRGDIITAVAETPTPDLQAFSAALEKLRREKPAIVLVSYVRGRATGFAALNLNIGENDKGESQ